VNCEFKSCSLAACLKSFLLWRNNPKNISPMIARFCSTDEQFLNRGLGQLAYGLRLLVSISSETLSGEVLTKTKYENLSVLCLNNPRREPTPPPPPQKTFGKERVDVNPLDLL